MPSFMDRVKAAMHQPAGAAAVQHNAQPGAQGGAAPSAAQKKGLQTTYPQAGGQQSPYPAAPAPYSQKPASGGAPQQTSPYLPVQNNYASQQGATPYQQSQSQPQQQWVQPQLQPQQRWGQPHSQQQQQQQSGQQQPAPYQQAQLPYTPSQLAPYNAAPYDTAPQTTPYGSHQQAAPWGQQQPCNAQQAQQWGAPPPQQPQWGSPQQQWSPQQLSPQQGQLQALPVQQASDMSGLLANKLQENVRANSLQAFYPPHALQSVQARLERIDWRALAAQWNVNLELIIDLAALALWDVVVLADDSGSMRSGDRIGDLKVILGKVSEVATLYDDDGISIRTLNSTKKGDHMRSSADCGAYIATIKFHQGTPLGEELHAKVLQPFLIDPIRSHSLRKPVLVMVITDGAPNSPKSVLAAIKTAKRTCGNSEYGAGCVAFEFAQVGRDTRAQEYLARLDNDPEVGRHVDATSYFELEQMEYAKRGVSLTPELWLVKLMCGAIDPTYDEQDE